MGAEQARTADAVLLIDTCGADSSIALAVSGKIKGERTMTGRTASAQIVEELQLLLREERRPQAIVVVHGPGSFTGVRVGLSAAKALAEAWEVPLFAVSRLEVLGEGIALGLAVADAGRGQLYVRELGSGIERLSMLSEVVDEAAEASLPLVAEAPLANRLPNALERALTAASAWPAAQRAMLGAPCDVALLDANYVRAESDIYARPGAPK